MFDFSAERTLQSVEESLKRLGLEYIDVIQVQKTLFSTCALLLDTSAPFFAMAFCCCSNQVFTYSISQDDRVK